MFGRLRSWLMDTTLKTEPLATQKRLVGRRVVELMTLCSPQPQLGYRRSSPESPAKCHGVNVIS